jgi:hypothetical protein
MGASRIAARTLAAVYIAAVTTLGASAFWTPIEEFTWNREAAALLLSLPALVVGIFAIYVLGPIAWHATNASSGGPMWPVTLVYTIIFAAMAITNVWLIRTHIKRHRAKTRPTALR